MDFGGNMFCLNNRDQNGYNSNGNANSNGFAWGTTWEPATSSNTSAVTVNRNDSGLANALMFLPQASSVNDGGLDHYRRRFPAAYGGEGTHVHPDPHLTCLKLGKRHYFEDTNGGGSGGLVVTDKRGKGYCSGSGGGGKSAAALTAASVPRCQVEGCHVALMNAKEYHRRHKVCEMHSKAPKVVVLGIEQRFCQQCSRFHVVSEFDDSKRSCRRRLAGHNERRRKSSHDSVARNSSQGGCALSLLSSRNDSWLSPADLSIKCSAALSELIAENRAAIMARQIVSERDNWHLHHHAVEEFKEIQSESSYFPQQMFPQTH